MSNDLSQPHIHEHVPTKTTKTTGTTAASESELNALLCADFDYELDSRPPDKGGKTLCGKLGRKHKMKRHNTMHTGCIYDGCDACQ